MNNRSFQIKKDKKRAASWNNFLNGRKIWCGGTAYDTEEIGLMLYIY